MPLSVYITYRNPKKSQKIPTITNLEDEKMHELAAGVDIALPGENGEFFGVDEHEKFPFFVDQVGLQDSLVDE